MKIRQRTLNFALKYFRKYGDTNIFPRAFEYDFISKDTIKSLANEDIGSWKTREYRKCLIPKNKFGFRIATQLDPIDNLIFTSLILKIGAKVEKNRVDKSIVYSYRFLPDSKHCSIFDRNVNFAGFKKKSIELAKKHKYVVEADISDFFCRVYTHRLENALEELNPSGKQYNNSICHLIKQWNNNVSYGIPIGPIGSMFLAEIVIDDVDKVLLDEGIAYCRYVDDYRLFADSKESAYEILYILANALFESQGLTLQQQKTAIYESAQYIRKNENLSQKKFIELSNNFQEILDKLGIDNFYEEISYDGLPEDIQKQVDMMSLEGMLNKEVIKKDIDISLVKKIIHIIAQTNKIGCLNIILKNINNLYPVFKDTIVYIQSLKNLSIADKKTVGKWLTESLYNSPIGTLDFHRLWITNIFAGDKDFVEEKTLNKIFKSSQGLFSKREIYLAMGEHKSAYWFRQRKRSLATMTSWDRRAFLIGSSCLPKDERKHWLRSVKRNLDKYESDLL